MYGQVIHFASRRPAVVLGPDGRLRGYGLGQVDPTAQKVVSTVVGTGGSIAAAPIGAALAPTLGLSVGLAVPIVGAAFAGLVFGIQALMNSGCGQTCVITSQYANKATQLMSDNLGAYLKLPAPRSQTAQAAYLANFDAIWNWLVQVCSQPGTGNAGVRCIQNQQRGSCPLKVSAYGWQQNPDGSWTYQINGPAGSGSNCWNYFTGFRDPIANDPQVVPDVQAADASSAGVPGLGGLSVVALLGLGLLAAGVLS